MLSKKKVINWRTGKKILAKTVALSMCVSLFQPGGGTKVLVHAAEETGNEIIKWDFEGSQEHGWNIPDGDKNILSDLGVTDGRLGATYKGDVNNSWNQAGIEIYPDSNTDFNGMDKVSFDFYYKDDNKKMEIYQ